MPIRFACPCGQELEAEPDHAGLATACPQCRRELTIPSDPIASAGPSPIPTAVRTKTVAPPRPPLTNRYNDDGSLARPKRALDDDPDVGPRRERHYDDHEAHEGEDDRRRPRMRRQELSAEPAGINWTLVGGSALVMLVTVPWAILAFMAKANFIFPIIGFIAGLVGVIRGLMGYQRD